MSNRGPPSGDLFTPDRRRLCGLDAHFHPNLSAQHVTSDSTSLGEIKKHGSSSSLKNFHSARLSPNTAPDIWDDTASNFAQSVSSYGASGKKQYASSVKSAVSSDRRKLMDKLKSGARNVTGYRKRKDYVSAWKEKKGATGTPSLNQGVKSDSDCGGDFEFIEPSTLRDSSKDILARPASNASIKSVRFIHKQQSNIPRPSRVLLNDINRQAVTLDKPTSQFHSSSPSYYPTWSPEESEFTSDWYQRFQTTSSADGLPLAKLNKAGTKSTHVNPILVATNSKEGEIQASESHNLPDLIRMSPGLPAIIETGINHPNPGHDADSEVNSPSPAHSKASLGVSGAAEQAIETISGACPLPSASLSVAAPKEICLQRPALRSPSDSMLMNLSMTVPKMSFDINPAFKLSAASKRSKASASPRPQDQPANRVFSASSVLVIVFGTAALIAMNFTLEHVGETMADDLGQKITYGLVVGIGISVALAIRDTWYNNLWHIPQHIAFYIGQAVGTLAGAAVDGYQVGFRQRSGFVVASCTI